MPIWQEYFLAQSIESALQALEQAPQPSCIIAGGTDLLLDLQQGRHAPVHTLVDITKIPEMNDLVIRQDRLYIGAAVALDQILASPLIKYHGEALFEAVSLIGGPQVRNTATLGGNVAHGLPAGDGTIALLALQASAEIAGLGGRRIVPLNELFLGPGKSTLQQHNELLVGFYLPLKSPHQGSAFQRIMRPQGVAIAILNLATWVHLDGEIVAGLRISLGPAAPVPFRANATEKYLLGKQINSETLMAAGEILLGEARFRSSPHRATAEYRRLMAVELLSAVLGCATRRARES
jgi:carbon-monoxide dehydrogenase medium subunit